MRARLLITGAVLVLLVAVSLAFCGDDAPGSEGLAAALSPERDVRATSRSVSREKTPLPADDLVEGAEAARRRWPPAAGEAGQTFDGGSLQDFIDEQGRQAIRQWLADNAVAAEKYVDRFCAETKDLAGRKDLGSPPRERDAAGYMAGRSDWEYGRLGMLHLPDSLTQRMGSPPQAWRSAGPELYAGLDFTWMTELLQFDHWSMLAAGPLKDTDGYSYFDAPIPNYVTLQYWVKLRLLKGVHEGNLAQASVEVRHLAELIGSSGTLVSEMIRIALFGIERRRTSSSPRPRRCTPPASRPRHVSPSSASRFPHGCCLLPPRRPSCSSPCDGQRSASRRRGAVPPRLRRQGLSTPETGYPRPSSPALLPLSPPPCSTSASDPSLPLCGLNLLFFNRGCGFVLLPSSALAVPSLASSTAR